MLGLLRTSNISPLAPHYQCSRLSLLIISYFLASSESLVNYMKEQNLSLKQLTALQKYIRGTFGFKSVEPYAHKKVAQTTHQVDEFFVATDLEFIEKDKKEIKNITRYSVAWL